MSAEDSNKDPDVQKMLKELDNLVRIQKDVYKVLEKQLGYIEKADRGMRKVDKIPTIKERQNKGQSRKDFVNDLKAIGRVEKRLEAIHSKIKTGKGGIKEKKEGTGRKSAIPNIKHGGTGQMTGQSFYKAMKQQAANMKQLVTGNSPGAKKSKKDQAGAVGDAMKGMMKFAVGGSIVGMLGKKLFDSSPLLKTMMSLLNTSVMLILRPIGDFFGAMLRPIMLFFLKNIAIPWFKQGKSLMDFGASTGKRILGFLLKPVETISAGIWASFGGIFDWITGILSEVKIFGTPIFGNVQNPFAAQVAAGRAYDGTQDWQLDQLMKSGNEDLMRAASGMKRYMGQGHKLDDKVIEYLMSGLGGGVGGTGGANRITVLEKGKLGEVGTQLDMTKEQSDMFTEMKDTITAMVADGDLSKQETAKLAELMKRASAHGITAVTALEFMGSFIQESATRLTSQYQTFKKSQMNTYSHVSTNVAATDAAIKSTQAVDMWNADGTFKGSTSDATSLNESFAAAISNANASHKSKVAEITDRRMNPSSGVSYYDRILNSDGTLKSHGEIKGIQDAMGIPNTAAEITRLNNQATAENSVVDFLANTLNLDKYRHASATAQTSAESQAAADILSKASGHYGKTASDYYQYGGTDPNLTWRDIMGMANGGIINEPILGIGKSGQAYAFGERGAETVTPGVGGGGQTNFILNLNVGNIGNNADYSELRDLVQRWVLEANSRRGII